MNALGCVLPILALVSLAQCGPIGNDNSTLLKDDRAYPDTTKHVFKTVGGSRGSYWSDESYAAQNGHITGIELYCNKQTHIKAIRARYGIIWGPWHGGDRRLTHGTAILDDPNDYFNRVYGRHLHWMYALGLGSSKGQNYGPWGRQDNKYFESNHPGCKLWALRGKDFDDDIGSLEFEWNCPF